MNPINIVKHLIGTPIHTYPISDKAFKENIETGYSGGSLAQDNVLVVSNEDLEAKIIADCLEREKSNFRFLKVDSFLDKETIINSAKELLGPYTHIVNVFFDKAGGELITFDNKFNDSDSVYQLYQWHQQEVDFLVNQNQYSTVCTVFVGSNSIDGNVKKKNVEMCVRGLAEVLANHGMICNGIIASETSSLEELLNYSTFLSSRYGQIMSGEVLFIDK